MHVARALTAMALLAVVACKGRDAAPAGSGTESGATPAAAGKRIGENKLITEPTFQFGPKDTVYTTVSTQGVSDHADLTAIWRFQTGQRVDSTTQSISPTGDENTEFHVVNPKGWPVGTYSVTIYANGDSVDSKAFVVKK